MKLSKNISGNGASLRGDPFLLLLEKAWGDSDSPRLSRREVSAAGRSSRLVDLFRIQFHILRSSPERGFWPCPSPCERGCPLEIENWGGEIIASCRHGEPVDDVPLTKADIETEEISLPSLFKWLREGNGWYEGDKDPLKDGAFLVGTTMVGSFAVSIVWLFNPAREGFARIMAIKSRIPKGGMVVITPSRSQPPAPETRLLQEQLVEMVRFQDVLKDGHTGEVDLQSALNRLRDGAPRELVVDDLFAVKVSIGWDVKGRKPSVSIEGKKIRGFTQNECSFLVFLAAALYRKCSADNHVVPKESFSFEVSDTIEAIRGYLKKAPILSHHPGTDILKVVRSEGIALMIQPQGITLESGLTAYVDPATRTPEGIKHPGLLRKLKALLPP